MKARALAVIRVKGSEKRDMKNLFMKMGIPQVTLPARNEAGIVACTFPQNCCPKPKRTG